MPNNIISPSLINIWKNYYSSEALNNIIKIYGQDGAGNRCALAAAKSILKFDGIEISQDEIAKKTDYTKKGGTSNYDLAVAMSDLYKLHNKDVRFINLEFDSSLYVSETSLRSFESYFYNALKGLKRPIILGISGIVPNKKNLYGDDLDSHDVLLFDVKIDKANTYKTKYSIADSNFPNMITKFTARDFLNFNINKSFDVVVPVPAEEYDNIFPQTKEDLRRYAKNIVDLITKTNTIYDEKQKLLLKELADLTDYRFWVLARKEHKFNKKQINLDEFNKFKKNSYIRFKSELDLLIDDYIDKIRLTSPELQYLLNKKINQKERDYDYLLKLEENKFVSAPVLMDTKFLVDHFKKMDEYWNPENKKAFFIKELDLIRKRKFYLQKQNKIDSIINNFYFKKENNLLTNKKIFFKFAKDSAVNYGKQLAFVSLIQFLLESNNEKSVKDVVKEFGKLAEQVAITSAIEGTINFSSSALKKSLLYHTVVGAVANGIASGIITAEEGKDAREVINSIIASGAGTLAYITTTAGVTMVVAGPVGEVVAIPVALLVSAFASIGVEKALNSFEKKIGFKVPNIDITPLEEALDLYEYAFNIEKISLSELKDNIKNILYMGSKKIEKEISSKKFWIYWNMNNVKFWYSDSNNKKKEKDLELLGYLVNEQIRNVNTELSQLFIYINKIINTNLSSEKKSIIYNQYSNKLNEFIEKLKLKVEDTEIKKIFYETLEKVHSLLALFQNLVLTDELLESYLIELENHESVDWEINLYSIIHFLAKEIKEYEPNLINLDPIYEINYLQKRNNLNIDSTLEKDEQSLIFSPKVEEFYIKNTKTIMLLKMLSKEEITRENYIKNLNLFNEISKQENYIDFSDNLNLFNNISTQFNTKFHSDILDLRTRLNNYNLSSPEQKENTEMYFELAESLYNDIKDNMHPFIIYKKITKYYNMIININNNFDKDFEEEKETLENDLHVFYSNELTDDYDYIKTIRTSLSELQNSEKEPEKYKENDFINESSINNYIQELEFLYDKKEKLIKTYNFSDFNPLSLNEKGLMELFIINNLILNTKDIINNFVNFFHHDENLDKSINKNLKIEQEKRTLLVEQLNLINNKNDISKDRIDYLNSVLDSYSYLQNQVEDSKESEYHEKNIKEFWKNEESFEFEKETINNYFNSQFYLQTKQQLLIPFVLSQFLDWLNNQKDNPEITSFVNIIKRNIERKMVFYTALETLKLNLFNKSFDYQNIINKLDINDNDKESLKQLYKNIQELEEHDNINSKNTTQNEPDTTTFKPDSFLTESPDHIKKDLEINIDNKKEELYFEWEKAISEIIDNYYLDLKEIDLLITAEDLNINIKQKYKILNIISSIYSKQEEINLGINIDENIIHIVKLYSQCDKILDFNNKIQSYVNKKNLSTSGLEILSYKVLDEPKLGQLAYKNSNFQEIPLNQTNGNDSSFDWPKIMNTAGWTIAGTVTLAGFGYGLYRLWKTGKPENVINPIKNVDKQSVFENEQLILKTINIDQREETKLTALEKDLLQASTIDIEEEIEEEWETTV